VLSTEFAVGNQTRRSEQKIDAFNDEEERGEGVSDPYTVPTL